MGYTSGMKGYKIHNISNKEIFISRDVFHEHIFPFHSITISEILLDPFSYLVLPKPADDPVLSSVPLPATSDIEYLLPPAFSITEQAAPISTSSRVSQPPSYLRDYHCNLLSSNSLDTSRAMYPLSDDYLSYDSLFNKHKHFILHVSSDYEPKFYHEAVHFPRWRAAMNKEISVMEDNQTWSVVPLPPGEHTVGCRWVYKKICFQWFCGST